MYELINANRERVVSTLAAGEALVVEEYEWLLENTKPDQIRSDAYRSRYRNYWELNVTRPSKPFIETYFATLIDALAGEKSLGAIVNRLYDTPTHTSGRKIVHFSFATKLLHMAETSTPIFDSFVAEFYFFTYPTGKDPQQKIRAYLDFHEFLVEEFARIQKDGLLKPAIKEFRAHFKPKYCSDEKIIDSLIWSFVNLLHKREIQYL